MRLENWYLFPVSILIATTAMASGIGGAVFFSPLFMIVLKLDQAVAIGTALTFPVEHQSSAFSSPARSALS